MFGIRSVLATALFSSSLLSSNGAYARPITLAEALAAADKSPTLGVAQAQVDQARGNLEQAQKYTYNPVLGGTAAPSRIWASDGTLFVFEIGISQAIELGGKRSARSRAAKEELDAASENRDAARNTLRAEIRRVFELALVAQARVGVTTENESAARAFQDAANERLKLGAATQTDVNVAASSLGRAMAARKAAERDFLLARQALGDALGVPGTDLDPSGALPTFARVATSEDQLVASALRERRDLAATEHLEKARSADVDLADARTIPDPELSVSWARDPIDQASSVVVGVRIELPLWNRNQGNRHAARALRARASIEARAFRVGIERDVRTSLRRYGAALDAIASFDQQVVGTLAENLKLARDSLAAGKLGLLDLNNVRRDLVDSQLTYLDSIAEAIEARAALERAIGRSPEGMP